MIQALAFLGFLLLLTLGPSSGAMGSRTYEAPRANGLVKIDGILEDPDWASAPWTEDFVDILGDDAPAPRLRTRAKLLWNEEYLYIGAELQEPHLWASLIHRDAIIYRDDDFEVFLDPNGDGLDYFEIEVNALGVVLDLFLDKPYTKGGRADIGWDVLGLETGVSLVGTLNDPSDEDRGWFVEWAIPWTGLAPPGNAPTAGESWRINFSRVDWPLEVLDGSYRKGETPTPENPHPESNWVWSPQGSINMHLPEKWGVVRFAPDRQNSLIDPSP